MQANKKILDGTIYIYYEQTNKMQSTKDVPQYNWVILCPPEISYKNKSMGWNMVDSRTTKHRA